MNIQSLKRVEIIARRTFDENLHRRVLIVFFVFGLLFVALGRGFASFSFLEQEKFLKDWGSTFMSLVSLLIALTGSARLIPEEIERRTLHMTLSKPVRFWEFVVGKYIGFIAILLIALLGMTLLFETILGWKMGEWSDAVHHIRLLMVHAPQMAFLVWEKMCLVTAFGVLLSLVGSSTAFTIGATCMLYWMGHLQEIAREAWGVNAAWFIFIPQFNIYEAANENMIGFIPALSIFNYTLLYVIVLLSVASLVLENKEL